MTIDRQINLPWPTRHRPFVALHLTRSAYCFRRRFEWIAWRVGFGYGCLFTDRGRHVWGSLRLPRRFR